MYAITALLALRYATVLEGGVTMDEVFYAQSGLSMFEGYMYGNPTHMHAPLAKYFIGLSQAIFGASTTAIRAPVAIFGIASVAATYWVGRYAVGRSVGTIAAALLALLPAYNYYATMAMLDVPLALIVTLLFGATVWWVRNSSGWRGAGLVGGLTVLAGATKVQGAIYVFGAVAVVVWMLIKQREEWRAIAGGFTVGATLTFLIVYFPFAFSPAPGYYGGADPPQIAQSLFSIPWIGGVSFAFAAAIVHNLDHLANGHRTIVAGQVYYYPPVWAFVYWITSYGGVPYLVGLVTAVTAPPRRFGDRGVRIGLAGFLLGPLLIHTLLSVKLERYLVPLYPLLSIAAAWGIVQTANTLVDVRQDWFDVLPSVRSMTTAAVIILFVAAVFPPAFATTVISDPIQTNTGIDDASDTIVESADRHESSTAVVSNPLPYRWHLGEHRVSRFTKNVHETKQFDTENRPVTLVGTDYNDIETVLNESQPCVVAVSKPWIEKTPETNPVNRYLQGHEPVKSTGDIRVFETCSRTSNAR
ncbi:glycosyltransferase family 39 protein [Halorhabdus salina]|uniref:glycosyltransferase family 39 protein n=1 Tax=Halorhabdus salina TaxID=2750670 RepID=UPI0015EF7839|nr:glycosyltransferase family 39 protein [Halorhabdus salina]